MEPKLTGLKKSVHPRSKARDWAIQFLYQCEAQKLYHFPESHFKVFVESFGLELNVVQFMQQFVRGVFENLHELNGTIEHYSKNWTLLRMPITDRCVLRIAAYELIFTQSPRKVVINEAIELAKKYGTADSGAFVNAVLDKIAHGEFTAPTRVSSPSSSAAFNTP